MQSLLLHSTFSEFAVLLSAVALLGLLSARVKQPLIIAYIAAGIILGPSVLGWAKSQDQIGLLAQLGVTILLFIVGLKLDLQQVRVVGPVALATGLGQLGFTIFFGFLLILALGKPWLDSLYLAVALTFSSTIIIVKLLTDKGELDSLHGRIAVGFLVVQDIAVVLAMMAISSSRGALVDAGWLGQVGQVILILPAAIAIFVFIFKFILPPLVREFSRNQELLLLFSTAWGTLLAALGEVLGFSHEAGAFLAGFALANTPFREAISSKLSSLRDFLVLFFFLSLGARLNFSSFSDELVPALVLSVFVLIGNPLIVLAIMGYMGYRARTSFFAGLTVAQISEFSIVFIALGVSLGHLSEAVLGLTTFVGIVTITLSTYAILNSQKLFNWLGPFLKFFERKEPFREIAIEESCQQNKNPDVLILGIGCYGQRLAENLSHRGKSILAVDFDPDLVQKLGHRFPIKFGDAEDGHFLESLPLQSAKVIVAGLPETQANLGLIDHLIRERYPGKVFAVVRTSDQEQLLKEKYPFQRESLLESEVTQQSATNLHLQVLSPYREAADTATDLVCRFL